MPKNDIFLAGPRSWKISIFWTFQKVFQIDENHHQLTTGHLKCKDLFIWMKNMQVCEMPKNDNLSQVRGHENLQFFRLFKKPFKMMKTTISWPQDTWNINICSFGWEICKFVKCPKMTFFSQVRGHEKLIKNSLLESKSWCNSLQSNTAKLLYSRKVVAQGSRLVNVCGWICFGLFFCFLPFDPPFFPHFSLSFLPFFFCISCAFRMLGTLSRAWLVLTELHFWSENLTFFPYFESLSRPSFTC